jgi:ribosomal protein L37E
VEVSEDRPGNRFRCPRCGGEASYHFDTPFCAIDGESLVYLADCQRCGLVKYRSPLLRADLACPTCLGQLVRTTTWDTPHRADQRQYFCPYCLGLAKSGLRPANRRAERAVRKVWRSDRRLFELRIHLRRFAGHPRHQEANQRQAELLQGQRRRRVSSAFEAIGDDCDVVEGPR